MSAASPSVSRQPSKLPPERVYVIGDVHGEYRALAELVESLPLEPEDTVIQIGDCINRGPESFEVVEYWLRFDRWRRYVLGGNHEMMFYAFLCEGDATFLEYGGEATLRSYERHGWRPAPSDPGSIPEAHLQFFTHAYPWTVSLLQTPEYIFTHAGYNLARPPQEQTAEVLLWGSVTGYEQRSVPQIIVRGHVPFARVTFSQRGWIGIDTGCGMGGYLSCLRLPDRRVFTARPPSFRPRFWEQWRPGRR